MKASFNSSEVNTFQGQINRQYLANYEAYKSKQLQGTADTVAKRQASKALIVVAYTVPALIVLAIVF